jgi:hypothetical protein
MAVSAAMAMCTRCQAANAPTTHALFSWSTLANAAKHSAAEQQRLTHSMGVHAVLWASQHASMGIDAVS